MKRIASIIGILIAVTAALPAHAAVFLQGDTLSVTAPVESNLYAAGGTVTVREPVGGDLLVAGGDIRVQARVGNTLQAAGGQVAVTAPVRNSARLAGGNVRISAPVGGDLVIGGGQVSVESGAVITGDLIVFGGTVAMEGKVRGALKVYGGQISLDGTVDGPAEVNAENVVIHGTIGGEAVLAAETLAIGPDAAFQKNVRYWTESGQAEFGSALQNGSTATFDARLERNAESRAYDTAKGASAAFAAAFGLYSLLSSALLLLLLLLLGRGLVSRAGDRLAAAPWTALLWGFVYFAVTPMLILLLLVTIIGIPVAFLALAIYIFSFVFCNAITSLVFTRWIEAKNGKHWGFWSFFGIALLVLIGLQVLLLIPILGWIGKAVFVFMAFGALLSAIAAVWRRDPVPAIQA